MTPCAGLKVVELAVGVSDLGLGLAGAAPGMILAGLGASVTRVTGTRPMDIDAREADVVLAYGPEKLVEGRGLGYGGLHAVNPELVYARCRPHGTVEDFGLLVEARAGFCSQLAGHRHGPIFVDVRASGTRTASLLLTSVLALLHRRARTGAGGWAETSLYDGMLATLGCMIGRSENAAPEIESYWEKGSTFPNFLYRCADGELIQVWFGGKGMYARLLDALGDEPSPEGYYADQMAGRLGDWAARWTSFFATRPRAEWITRLRDAGVACEPVLGPGEILADPHLAETGLAVRDGRDIVAGSPISVVPRQFPGHNEGSPSPGHPGLLGGLRVADFSAFVAGPLAAEVLGDLGADVIKVEPVQGEAMRAAAYAIAACQRGKRSLALNITAPEARPVVERLLGWADVVLHNFRPGVAERLGIDEATVARLNPGAVYCHASAFGATGPRASFPGNDALMQAVTGVERAIGGAGSDPLAATWIPVDMAGGWLAAAGVLAGLYARAVSHRGESVVTSLLGAGVLMHSGVFLHDGELVPGPELDAHQTGYGPGYRVYEASDGSWFALVVPDREAWRRLRTLVPALPVTYAPLRGGPADAPARQTEAALEAAFATATAVEWVVRLRSAGLLAEPIEPLDRDAFRRAILDDPVNRQLGRVVAYQTADWGHFEQIGPLSRFGPQAGSSPWLMLPGVGEHTMEILTELGLTRAEMDALLAAKGPRQLDA
jgi:crotonobetainyl-CoA:carnitine CoA-transferase CaiB-like acyl-CoA transferase